MPERLLRAAADEWADALADLRVEISGSVVVAGEGAEAVAEVLQQIGAPWLLGQGEDFALLGAEEAGSGTAPAGLNDVAANSVDVVVLVRAWQGRSTLVRVLADATRAVTAGGAVVTAEVDFARLRTSRPDRYSAALLYRRHPEVAAAIAPGFLDTLDLTMEVNRAGFRSPSLGSFDRSIGRYVDRDSFLAEAPQRWRGFQLLSEDDAAGARAALAAAVPPFEAGSAIVDREPWTLVSGRMPGGG